MVCHCTLAGTQACFGCPRYQQYFGQVFYHPTFTQQPPPELDYEKLADMIAQKLKEVKEFIR